MARICGSDKVIHSSCLLPCCQCCVYKHIQRHWVEADDCVNRYNSPIIVSFQHRINPTVYEIQFQYFSIRPYRHESPWETQPGCITLLHREGRLLASLMQTYSHPTLSPRTPHSGQFCPNFDTNFNTKITLLKNTYMCLRTPVLRLMPKYGNHHMCLGRPMPTFLPNI